MYTKIETSTLQTSVNSNEETDRNEGCIEGATAGARSKRRALSFG